MKAAACSKGTHAHTHTHAHAHTHTHKHTHTHARTHTRTCTHTLTHTLTHTRAHTHACKHKHSYKHTQKRTHASTYFFTHLCSHPVLNSVPVHRAQHTQTNTRTQHTRIYILSLTCAAILCSIAYQYIVPNHLIWVAVVPMVFILWQTGKVPGPFDMEFWLIAYFGVYKKCW